MRVEPLTYTEEQILAYLREGRYDAEIAVRLGISNAEVGRRIEAICRKTGLPDKAALRNPEASAPPQNALDASEELPAEESEAPDAHSARTGRLVAIAGALVTCAVVAGVAMFALGRSDEPASSEPASGMEALATEIADLSVEPRQFGVLVPTPSNVIDGATPVLLSNGPSMPLPADLEMIFMESDEANGTKALLRAYRLASMAEPVTEVLYAPPAGFQLYDVLSTNDGSDIVVQVGPATDDGSGSVIYQFFRSRDAGITWTSAGPPVEVRREGPSTARGAFLAAFDGDDIVIGIAYEQETQYLPLQGGAVLADQGEHVVPWTDTSWARRVPSPNGIGFMVGRRTYTFGPNTTYAIHDARYFEPNSVIAATWDTGKDGFVGIYGLDRKALAVVETGQSTRMSIAGWLDWDTTVATFTLDGTVLPVLFAPGTGEMNRLELPVDGTFAEIVAVRRGPSAAVNVAEGECLELRDRPSLAANVAGCAAPGVRLLASGLSERTNGEGAWFPMTVGQYGPVGWVQPGPALSFDDPDFDPGSQQHPGNPLAIVRPAPGMECAEVRRAAGAQEPVVACLPAGTMIGRAPTSLGGPGDTAWYGVFQPEMESLCDTYADCLPETIGFVEATFLDLGR